MSVLHHIPKVSAQIRELARVLSSGGHMLVHKPIGSFGDWTGPRKAGITKHERGIPLSLLRSMLTEEGLVVEYEALCDFPITRRLPAATTLSGRFASIGCCRRPPPGTTATTPRPHSRRSAQLARFS
jgi:hypothetical protein